ncbi:hypothetical protein SRABI26_01901 [Arthrobacter sp. Bi26]|nr:hypothetical protein SRABI26_01901 [Arthrobacter sp. Bi26]
MSPSQTTHPHTRRQGMSEADRCLVAGTTTGTTASTPGIPVSA